MMVRRTLWQAAVLLVAAVLAGFVSNAARGRLDWRGNDPTLLGRDVDRISVDEAGKLHEDPATLFLDVREAAAFDAQRVQGAVAFPADRFDAAYAELRDFLGPEVRCIVYGDETLPAVRAAEFLEARGHSVRVLDGGWIAWQRRGLPAEGGAVP